MKFTRKALKTLIFEELNKSRSVLLEMPSDEGAYRYRDEEVENELGHDQEPVDLLGQELWHLARRADQLHDMLRGDDKLVDKYKSQVERVAEELKEVFEAAMYDKQNPTGMQFKICINALINPPVT